MAYTKPVVIAQNSVTGSFVAGCPTNTRARPCRDCELTR